MFNVTLLNRECPCELKEFDFTISHIKGTVNLADFLSQHPFDITTETVNIIEEYVNVFQNKVFRKRFHYKRFQIKQKMVVFLKKMVFF